MGGSWILHTSPTENCTRRSSCNFLAAGDAQNGVHEQFEFLTLLDRNVQVAVPEDRLGVARLAVVSRPVSGLERLLDVMRRRLLVIHQFRIPSPWSCRLLGPAGQPLDDVPIRQQPCLELELGGVGMKLRIASDPLTHFSLRVCSVLK